MELDKVIEILVQSALGRFVLVILGVAVISIPLLEKTFNIFSGAKDRKAKRQQELLEKEIESEKFRRNIENFVEQVPILSSQIEEMGKRMEEFNNRESTIEESQSKLIDKVEEIEKSIRQLKQDSDRKDNELQSKLDITVNQVASLDSSMQKVSSNTDLMIESDLDEFRTYIMGCHTKYVVGREPLDRHTKQIMKTKYRRYKKEGGNGWAESLMEELDELPVTEDFGDSLET